jgi:hypothetical protein
MKLVNLELLLPEDIPAGESVLWYGKPEVVSLARRAFRADIVAIYFTLMSLWNFGTDAVDKGWLLGLVAAGKTLAAGVLGLALVFFLAWLSARTTLYVMTNKRLVMKVGIALPVFFNIPFKTITNASVRTYKDGSGDIPVVIAAPQRIAYLHLWPHARPFHFRQPEPALRCVANAQHVAGILGRALATESSLEHAAPVKAHDINPTRGAHAGYPADAAAAA